MLKSLSYCRSVHFLPIDANCKGNCTYIKVVNHEAEAADDATAGMIIVILLFIIPSSLNFWPFVTGIVPLYLFYCLSTVYGSHNYHLVLHFSLGGQNFR